MKTILFTGGGSAGHVTANLALMPEFMKMGWDIIYIGSRTGIEASLVQKLPAVHYVAISTGKLRRYFSIKNFTDPFRVLSGIWEAYWTVRKYKPAVVFSRGGFVAVPVILAAWLNGVPIIMYESNITPGLANKITAPFADRICFAFRETARYLGKNSGTYVGPIIRPGLKDGIPEKGRTLCGFSEAKPVLLVMGGSLGSRKINEIVRKNMASLLDVYQVAHICGKGGIDTTLAMAGYKQFEYIHGELADLLAVADMVISRAGANSIFEFLSLHKPMLLIPLPMKVSRGDQILNAKSFVSNGYAEVLWEEDLTDDHFLAAIAKTASGSEAMREKMRSDHNGSSLDSIVELIYRSAKQPADSQTEAEVALTDRR